MKKNHSVAQSKNTLGAKSSNHGISMIIAKLLFISNPKLKWFSALVITIINRFHRPVAEKHAEKPHPYE